MGASALKLAVCGVRHMWISTPPFVDPSRGSQLVSKTLASFQSSVATPATFAPALPPSTLRFAFDISTDPVVPLALVLAFAFFLRVSEYSHTPVTGTRLHVSDVTPTPRTLRITIRVSKRSTKPTQHERAATGTRWCPLALFHAYAKTRRFNDPESPALQWLDGSPVTSDDVNSLVKRLCRRAATPSPDAYSSHSMRAGGAVAALVLEKDTAWILREGRWASVKSLLLYIRTLAEPYARATLAELLPGIFSYAW